MEPRTRVFVADDHPLYRASLGRLIAGAPDLELVGEADNGRDALEQVRTLSPGVLVLDIQMPELDGMAVLRAVVREGLPVNVLLLSGHVASEIVFEAVQTGAKGFISKDEDEGVIETAIAAVGRGETVLGANVQAAIADEVRARAPADTAPVLSERELEVLRLTAAGKSSSEIGDELHLSPATVKTHLQRTYGKLGVSDRAAAVAEAMRRGLLD